MRPLLGPFLGHVTHDAAVAWVRLPRHAPTDMAEVLATPLEGASASDPAAARIAALTARTGGVASGVVRLPGGPGTMHRLDVRLRGEGPRPAVPLGEMLVRAAPPPAPTGRIAFAFGSCWKPDAVGDAPATWRDVRALSRSGYVDHLILLGDQIYADTTAIPTSPTGRTAVRRALRLGRRAPLEARASGFRETYQRAFEVPEVAAVLSSLPVTSVWDDHEITNGFGSERWHREPEGLALFEAAALAHDEFQDSRNPDRLEPSCRAHGYRRGPAAFLALDLRTHRDAPAGILLGAAQREAIAAWLTSEDARSARVLFVLSSVPLLHLSRAFHWLRGRADLEDQWSSKANEGERAWLLARLREYEGASRTVIVLGGDSHLATAATARGREGRVLWQLTSSPLAQRLPAYVYPALTALGRRFHVRVEGEGEQELQAHIVGRWVGANVGVVTGEATGEELDLQFELFRPGRRTVRLRLTGLDR